MSSLNDVRHSYHLDRLLLLLELLLNRACRHELAHFQGQGEMSEAKFCSCPGKIVHSLLASFFPGQAQLTISPCDCGTSSYGRQALTLEFP